MVKPMHKFILTAVAILTLTACGGGTDNGANTGVFADVALEHDIQYEWSARAITSSGVGQWSPGIEFSVHQTEELALDDAVGEMDSDDWNPLLFMDGLMVPTVVTSSPAGSIVGLNPTFRWKTVNQATFYEIRVLNHESGEVVFSDEFAVGDVCDENGCEAPSSQTNVQTVSNEEDLELVAAIPSASTQEAPLVSGINPIATELQSAIPVPDRNSSLEQEVLVDNVSELAQESQIAQEAPLAQVSQVGENNGVAVNGEIEALQQSEGVLAFPGALGYGKHSVGGRGGRVITVNTVENIVDSSDNLMSLREAIEHQSGPRTIVFEVGGVFDVGINEIQMNGEDDSNVTVACQTAPSPGVIIRTYGFNLHSGVHDIIFRHCAIRGIDRGGNFGQAGRSFTVRSGSRDIIFDHMSLAWATDENFQVYLGQNQSAGISNVTLSNSVVAEGDADSSHYLSAERPEWSYHAMGPSCNNSNGNPSATLINCSIVNNFIAHNSSRNAMIWGGTGELSNNIIYNWYGIGLTVQPHDGSGVSAIINNNLMKSGPNTSGATKSGCAGREHQCALFLGASNSHGDSHFSLGDNYFIPRGESIGDAYLIDHPQANSPEGTPSYDLATPSPISVLQMANSSSRFISCVGATRPLRDHVDTRVIQEFYDGTGRIGIGENTRNGGHNSTVQRTWSQFGATAYHSSNYDTDGDGMPNDWEVAYGLNPSDYNDHSGDLDGDGYTNIEEFLAIAAHC